MEGFDLGALAELTAEPARYGLHATLKAPFRLASGWSEDALESAVGAFAAYQYEVNAPTLRIAQIGRFLALTVSRRSLELDCFAAACVRRFDIARAQPEPEELARRRSSALTSEQERNLQLWGYPYVMRDYTFHVTLTGPVDARTAARLSPLLTNVFAPVTASSLQVREIALFKEPKPHAPFRLLNRYALRAGALPAS